MDDTEICMVCAFITDCTAEKMVSACENAECFDFIDVSLLPPEDDIDEPEQYEVRQVTPAWHDKL